MPIQPVHRQFIYSKLHSDQQGSVHQNFVIMSKALSHNFFAGLYETKNSAYQEPVLQILGFEQSQTDSKQITIRLSDGYAYLDCSLVGPYVIVGDRIKTSEHARAPLTFKKFDLLRILNYFFKIDLKRICRLVIVIRKVTEEKFHQQKIGRPQQISQYAQNQAFPKHNDQETIQRDLGDNSLSNNRQIGPPNDLVKIEQDCDDPKFACSNTNNVSLAGYSNSNGHHPHHAPNSASVSVPNGHSNGQGTQQNCTQNSKIESQYQNQSSVSTNRFKEVRERNSEEPLTLKDIMNNHKGYFVGRLVRAKFTVKQTAKDKPLSFLYLGFLDSRGEIVRITLAGSYAIKQRNELKVGKCYYISELESFQTDKMSIPSIKFKDKETKIHEVTASNVVQKYKMDYFHWEHEFDYIQAEFVDVIGIVDKFQEKVCYKQPTGNDSRQVIRVAIRNHQKTTRISFWAEQIKNLQSFNLKRNQAIILLDVKKKKKFYLDFTFESDIVKLSQRPDLRQRFQDVLPNCDADYEPRNLRQLHELYEKEPSDNQVRLIKATISKITENRIIYRLCDTCKAKMQRTSGECPICQSTSYYHKFNCYLEIADFTASMSCVAFDNIAQVLRDKTADELSLLPEEEMKELLDKCSFGSYLFGIENKNHRYLIRSIEHISEQEINQDTKKNIKWVNEILVPSD